MSLLCPEGLRLPSTAHNSEGTLCSDIGEGTTSGWSSSRNNTVLMKSFVQANLTPSELAWVSLHDTFVLESQHVAIIRLWQAAM